MYPFRRLLLYVLPVAMCRCIVICRDSALWALRGVEHNARNVRQWRTEFCSNVSSGTLNLCMMCRREPVTSRRLIGEVPVSFDLLSWRRPRPYEFGAAAPSCVLSCVRSVGAKCCVLTPRGCPLCHGWAGGDQVLPKDAYTISSRAATAGAGVQYKLTLLVRRV